jgi:DNA-binding response OmpR family regulator
MVTPLAPGIRQQEIAPSWAPQGSPSIDDLHLLVVDECLLLAILSTSLRAMGCHVYGACSGQEAIRILQTTAVDLVLLDLCLPDMDGHALCSQIRQQFQLPVVVMSALRESVDILLAFHAGADAYVQKPFQFRDLTQKLQRAIANQTSPIAAPSSCPPEPLPDSNGSYSDGLPANSPVVL